MTLKDIINETLDAASIKQAAALVRKYAGIANVAQIPDAKVATDTANALDKMAQELTTTPAAAPVGQQ